MRRTLIATTILTSAVATAAFAQLAPPPPVRPTLDGNGVDLFYGSLTVAGPSLIAGSGDRQALAYQRINNGSGWSDNIIATLNLSGSVMTVTLDGIADRFNVSGSTYSATEGNGATLSYNSTTQIYTYTSRDGSVIHFDAVRSSPAPYYASAGRIIDRIDPSGRKLTYTYDSLQYCTKFYVTEPDTCQIYKTAYRIATARNSFGYRVSFSYDTINPINAPTSSDVQTWSNINAVTVNNLGSTVNGATQTISATAITDPLNRTTSYRYSNGLIAGITHPGHASEDVTIAYASGRVSSVTAQGVATSYSSSDAGDVRTTIATDAVGGTTKYEFSITSQRLKKVTDPLLQVTQMAYDGNGRRTETIFPESNKVQSTYDARGNVMQTRAISKTPGTPPDIVTSAVYPASCTNAATCNQPTSTTDAKGNVTSYTYDPTHGGVLSVTSVAAASGGVQPQARFGYTAKQAYFDTGSGSIVASGQNEYLLTSSSVCRTTASCAGTADEVRTTVDYGPQVAGTPNNLLPVSTTTGAGDGSLSATTAVTYDVIGNVVSVDGPLAGAADTSVMQYDAARQLRIVAGPDPDGTGPLKNRARRFAYNADGQVTNVEVGTTDGQTPTALQNFNQLQQTASIYDANGRKTYDSTVVGSTTYNVTQYSYDVKGRLDCTAVRMNPAVYGSLPAACVASTQGADGPDRITRTLYDAADQVTKVQTAYGTADQADEQSITQYTPNGKPYWLVDANNNVTTYVYDGFDRLSRVVMPSPTSPGNGSPTDYEDYTYDANSNVTQRRLRDGQLINFSYDNLNRLVLKDVPNSVIHEYDITYKYDLLGRLTEARDANTHVTLIGYDALGRQVSEQSNWTTRTMQYDLAGRRTRLTWGDGFYVLYNRNVVGDMINIMENGQYQGIGVLGTYFYNDLGQMTDLYRGNGVATHYFYDPVGRLTMLQHLNLTTPVQTTFTYNAANQITSTTRDNDAYAWNGHYNVDRPYAVNGINQLTSAGSTTLGYDGRGNLTSSGSSTYGYTSENRMATGPGGLVITYDPLGRLHWLGVNTYIPWMQYDGDKIIQELGDSGTLRRYVYGPGDEAPLVWYEGSGTNDRRFLVTDERGSVVAITDPNMITTAINRYDEYGIPAATNVGRFQYTGQAWLPELGMQYSKARIYSPSLGRFMQTDPIGYGDGMNMYGYVGGDPVNFIDPLGLKAAIKDSQPAKPSTQNGKEPPADEEGDPITVTATRIAKPDVRQPDPIRIDVNYLNPQTTFLEKLGSEPQTDCLGPVRCETGAERRDREARDAREKAERERKEREAQRQDRCRSNAEKLALANYLGWSPVIQGLGGLTNIRSLSKTGGGLGILGFYLLATGTLFNKLDGCK